METIFLDHDDKQFWTQLSQERMRNPVNPFERPSVHVSSRSFMIIQAIPMPQLSTLNSQLSTLNSQLNPQRSTLSEHSEEHTNNTAKNTFKHQ